MVIKNGSVLSEKVGGGSEGSNGGSENGSGVFLEVKSSIVSLLDDSVVSSVSSEVSVTIKVSSDKSHDTSANGESVMEDSPSDTFPARRGSERTFVGVELIGVEAVHEALKRYHRFGLAPPCRGAFSGTTSTSRDVVRFMELKKALVRAKFYSQFSRALPASSLQLVSLNITPNTA